MNNLPDNYKDYYANKTCHVKRQVKNVCNTTVGSLEIVKSQKCSGNLHVDGNANIHNINTQTLNSDTIYTNNIEIFRSLDISGDASIMSDLSVNGNLVVGGTIVGNMLSNFEAGENITLIQDSSTNIITISSTTNQEISFNDIEIFGTLDIHGNSTMMSDLSLNGNLVVGEDVSMNKNVFIGGDLVVGTTDILSELSKQETRIIMEAEGPIEVDSSPFSQGMGSPSEPGFGTYEFDKAKITKISLIMYTPGAYFDNFSIRICSSDNSGNIDLSSTHVLIKEGNTYVSDTINRDIEEKHIWWIEIALIATAPSGQDETQRLRLCAHILRE